MWLIENPRNFFNYLHESQGESFELVCIIPFEKYINFPYGSRIKLENLKKEGFSIATKQIKDPNNPAKLIDCKLIKFLV